MGDSRRYVFLVLIFLIIPLFQSTLADRTNHESPALTLFQDDGLIFNDTLYLNGSSTVPLTNFEWLLVDISNELKIPLDSGKLTFVHAVSEAEWEWNLVLNVSSYNCTCELIVFDTYSNSPPLTSKVIYIGSQNHHPVLLPFLSPYQSSHPVHLVADQNMELVVPVVTPIGSGSEFFVKLGICPAPNGFCLNEMIDYFDFNFTSESQELKLIFDPDNMNLDDGYWLFNITVVDALLRTSNTEHFMVLFDQTEPSVTLTCDLEDSSLAIDGTEILPSKSRVEEFSPISFSASVEDGYSGGDNIFTWTLLLPDGSRRALLANEQVTDTVISLKPDIPGTWVVELLVRDTAGWLVHSSIEFEVQNIAPIIQIELDSHVITEGSTVTLTEGETWELNSSKSSDTINDNSDLLYTWYVNDHTFATGETTLQSSDFSESGLYDVRLVVEDNDGASSEVSFKVHISETVSPDTFNAKAMLLSVSIIVLIVFVIGFIISSSRRNSNQTTVPKWIVNDTSEQFKKYDESDV
ncbi:MAG: PKD domain-containing protein [Candidatus Poseidoniales archaeon]